MKNYLKKTARVLLKIIAGLFIASTSALAEVCDKARPNWNPTDGPVNQLDELWLFLTSPFGVGLFIVFLMGIYFRNAWMSGVVVFAFVALALLIGLDWWEFLDTTQAEAALRQVTQDAVREGCMTSPVSKISALIFVAIALIMVTFKR